MAVSAIAVWTWSSTEICGPQAETMERMIGKHSSRGFLFVIMSSSLDGSPRSSTDGRMILDDMIILWLI
jgi:hypothetical protein